MSAVLATASPRRIKASHRRRRKVTAGHFVQRYYDPQIGRFLSIDPVATDPNSGASFNAYKYASNNPYRFTDPDGRHDFSYLSNDDGLMAASRRLNIPGMFVMSSHATADGLFNPQTNKTVQSDQVARVAEMAGHQPQQPMFMFACEYAKGGEAQALATKTLSPVYATKGFAMMASTDAKKPYVPGDPYTVTANSKKDGTGSQMTFERHLPFGTRPIGPAISSIRVDPKNNTATIRYEGTRTGSRLPIKEVIKLDK